MEKQKLIKSRKGTVALVPGAAGDRASSHPFTPDPNEAYISRCVRSLKAMGLPLDGWRCKEVVDVKEEDKDADLATCSLCGCSKVRYLHIMEHPGGSGLIEDSRGLIGSGDSDGPGDSSGTGGLDNPDNYGCADSSSESDEPDTPGNPACSPRSSAIYCAPDTVQTLAVGCICAGVMEDDIFGAKERDRQARNRAARRRTFLRKPWETGIFDGLLFYKNSIVYMDSAVGEQDGDNGNTGKNGGVNAGAEEYSPRYNVFVDDVRITEYKGKPICDPLSAKYAAYDVLDPVKRSDG